MITVPPPYFSGNLVAEGEGYSLNIPFYISTGDNFEHQPAESVMGLIHLYVSYPQEYRSRFTNEETVASILLEGNGGRHNTL